jgi:hypothetical protein
MSPKRRLFITVAEGAVSFAVASWALVLVFSLVAPRVFTSGSSLRAEIAATLVVFLPDGLVAWWILRRVRASRLRDDARRATTAFAVSAPLALGVGYLLGELVGGYAEVILGSRFILPAMASFIIVLIIFVPSGVVMWALHPSRGAGPVGGSD